MKHATRFCRNRRGERLAYTTWGSGPVLVAPPGWVSHLELQWEMLGMDPFFERLAARHQLVFYDKRGTGLSDRERDDFSLEGELADLETIVDEVTPGAISLFGNSQGGPLAMAYAARHPDRVRRLVLSGAYVEGRQIAPASMQASLLALVRASWGVGSETLALLFMPGCSPESHKAFARFQREAASQEMAARLLGAVYAWDVRALLPKVAASTLVIHRRRDKVMSSKFASEIAGAIPGAKLVMLEGEIHFPWCGDWEPIARLVDDFVAEGTVRDVVPAPAAVRATSSARRYEITSRSLSTGPEMANFRLGLAQTGGVADLFERRENGLFRLPPARVAEVGARLRRLGEQAASSGVDLLVFPEMSVDLNYPDLEAELAELARRRDLVIVAGGYHDEARRTNVCKVIGPSGLLWEQRKHIPATIQLGGRPIEEGIEIDPARRVTVAETRFGRIALAVCRDFLDLELLVALKNAEPPVDVVINPAFTPVTADFDAAHFGARRALYAVSVFCNVAVFGGSGIYSPEKRKRRVHVPAGREAVVFRDVPLLAMRAERSLWEARTHARFIQSTRTS